MSSFHYLWSEYAYSYTDLLISEPGRRRVVTPHGHEGQHIFSAYTKYHKGVAYCRDWQLPADGFSTVPCPEAQEEETPPGALRFLSGGRRARDSSASKPLPQKTPHFTPRDIAQQVELGNEVLHRVLLRQYFVPVSARQN